MDEKATLSAAEEVAEEAIPVEGAETAEAVPAKKKRKPINQQKLQDNLWGWIFCLPLIVGTVWFVYVALVMALMLSFTDYMVSEPLMEYLFTLGDHPAFYYDKLTQVNVEGADAWYKYIFAYKIYIKEVASLPGDGYRVEMWYYMFNTVFYMIGIPIGMILSMFFAVCMSRDIKGGNLFRVLYYLPCVASSISIVFTFRILFKTQGVMNQIFGLSGGEGQAGFAWLIGDGNQTWNDIAHKDIHTEFYLNPFWCQGLISKCVIIIMSVWKGLGGTIILYVAGLSGVNAATKEAAQIDGANGWQIFWKVTMPDLYPTIFYNIVTAVIGGMQIYAEPVLMYNESYLTSGYVSLIWNKGINKSDLGNAYASAGAAYGMFLAVIILVLTLFQFWLDSRNKD